MPPPAGWPVTVAGTLSMNLPHAYEAQCGSWRDWVLGLTVVLADGTIATLREGEHAGEIEVVRIRPDHIEVRWRGETFAIRPRS